jgi:transposase InsO family protein
MSDVTATQSPHRQLGAFRHAVVGPLLAAPPARGQLASELDKLASKEWVHPVTGEKVRLGRSTIEAWYYAVRDEKKDPLAVLRTKPRGDIGKSRAIDEVVAMVLVAQYERYPFWSYRLHSDNLGAALAKLSPCPPKPSYPTVRRFLKARGLRPQKKPRDADRDTAKEGRAAAAACEVRSFQTEHVNALWHLDYHKAPLKVLGPDMRWYTPVAMGIFDDCSRLCCHAQWFLFETAENLIHAYIQALQKRGIPRAQSMDNGAAMIAVEVQTGLSRLGIVPRHIRPYSPYQNGKCEFVWSQIDGRLMAMLDGQKGLTLQILNDITQAWVEHEYNRRHHSEIGTSPLERFTTVQDVGRPAPGTEMLKMAFRREVKRTQRRSDGTVSIANVRFEVPSEYRHIEELTLAYALWDLGFVHILDPRTGEPAAQIFPVDKALNAVMGRRPVQDIKPLAGASLKLPPVVLPPLLQQYVDQMKQSGLPPAYIPKDEQTPTGAQL